MENLTLDTIIDNLFYLVPLVHKKFLNIDPAKISCEFNLSRLQAGVMWVIHEKKTLPMSDIAKKLLISKPQMSLLINQLVKSGMVERQMNKEDRRITNITLTPKGCTTLSLCYDFMRNNMKENLSYLNKSELEELSQILLKLRSFSDRLDHHG